MLRASTTKQEPELSIVIPAFNEADRIGASLDKIKAFCQAQRPETEVLVVDDGSVDRTAALVVEMAKDWPQLKVLQLERNRGKGFATRAGVLAATGKWILCSDADLSTPIDFVEPMLEAGQTHPVVIGSRSIPGAQIARRQPLHRVFMGRVFNWFVRTLAAPGCADSQCGFKLYRRDAGRDIFEGLTVDGFAFDVEVLFLAHRLGYAVAEVAVEWHNDERSKVSVLLDPARMFVDVLRLRWRHRKMP